MSTAKRAAKLQPSRISLAEYKRNLFRVAVEIGTTQEDLVNAEFWAHVAKQLRVGDKLEVYPPDQSFYAELLVASVLESGVVTRVIHFVTFADVKKKPPQRPAASEYDIRFMDKNKFAVIRKSDKEVLQSGFDTKPQAEDWLLQYELGLE